MKITISVPDELFSAAESLAARLGVSRSQLYANALAQYVAKHAAAEVTGRLDRLYSGEESRLDPAFHRAQRESLSGDAVREALEAMEDVALLRAIEEVEGSGAVSRDEVFRALDGRA